MSTSFESHVRRNDFKMSSERSLGIVLAVFFFILGIVKGQKYLEVLAVCFLSVAFLKPAFLVPLNVIWFRLGLVMHKITNPLIMSLVFFVIITPLSLLLLLFRKDILSLKIDPNAQSYWIHRDQLVRSTLKDPF